MADIQYYERILKKKEPRGKALLITAYIVMLSVWFVIAVRYALTAAIILMIPLSIFIAVILTWKYTCVEYEYSFSAGTFTFSKIYGKSKRKTFFSTDLGALTYAKPYDAERDGNAEYSKFINAIPTDNAKNPCICVFNIDDEKIGLLFDCDEMSAKILKFFKASAVDRELIKRASASADNTVK